jgi:hypothetical protein
MQKIKRFKISLRPTSVRKNFKVLAGEDRLTPEAEEVISQEYERALLWISSAAVFETFRRDQWPSWAAVSPGSVEPAAVSMWVATIGPDVEGEIERSGSPDRLRSLALTALAEEAVEAAAGFITRLLSEEAKKEDCELGSRDELKFSDHTAMALASLGADKIGVSLKDSGGISPRFTRISFALWIPRMTKKRRLFLAPDKTALADKSV